MFREFSFRSRHIGEEQSANILQPFLNKFLDLLKPSVEPAAISREEFFADRIEFLLALPELIEQRSRSMSLGDGSRQIGDLCLQLFPFISHDRQVGSCVIQARAQLALEFFEGECGEVFSQHFPLQPRDKLSLDPVTANHQRIGAHAAILVERASILCPPDAAAPGDQHDVGTTETALEKAGEEIPRRVGARA